MYSWTSWTIGITKRPWNQVPAFCEAPQPGGCSGCGPLLEKDETAIAGGGKAGHCLAEPEVHKSHASRVLHMFGHMNEIQSIHPSRKWQISSTTIVIINRFLTSSKPSKVHKCATGVTSLNWKLGLQSHVFQWPSVLIIPEWPKTCRGFKGWKHWRSLLTLRNEQLKCDMIMHIMYLIIHIYIH